MRLLLTAFTVFFVAIFLYSQEPIIKFYFSDNNQPKEYKIYDIDVVVFSKSNLSYSMHFFSNGSMNAYNLWDINFIEIIDSTKLKIDLDDSAEVFNISQIDSIVFISNACTETVIGTQTWMCKNLDVSSYRNGDTIPQIIDPKEWVHLETGAWCYYNNDPAYGEVYGKLYNWYAVNDPRGLAPEGWHIPSDSEWTVLSDYLGGWKVAGGKLKSRGILGEGNGLWRNPNLGATNEVGFSALPGGVRESIGTFYGISYEDAWWTSTDYYSESAWYRFLRYNEDCISIVYGHPLIGCSVRCVKD